MSERYLTYIYKASRKVYLEAQGIKTVTGKAIWDTKTIQRMLINEKYKGDTMLQKIFTDGCLALSTRIEKGKEVCPHSPTLDEGWVQDTLGVAVCQNGVYDEGVIRNEVDKIRFFDAYILIF